MARKRKPEPALTSVASFRITARGKRPVVVKHPRFDYTTTSSKCNVDTVIKKGPNKGQIKKRESCPVQLIFSGGQPMLRFCRATNKPGYAVPVNDPQEAQRLAEESCRCWHKNNRNFDKCKISAAGLRGLRGLRGVSKQQTKRSRR